jgi:hypothetical protein
VDSEWVFGYGGFGVCGPAGGLGHELEKGPWAHVWLGASCLLLLSSDECPMRAALSLEKE